MKFASLVAIASLINVSNAWWGTGHLLVARVAHDILEAQSPSTLANVNSILAYLKKSDPSWTSKEGDHPMVECTTFADDIKFKGGAYQNNWHFIDTPFLDEGGSISDFNFTMDAHNVTEAMNSIVSWFN
jgi:hypothetical protein